MRFTVIVLLLAVAPALAVTPARAQFGDPLTLMTAGALLPFVNNDATGEVSILEITSPVTDVPNLHLVFFNATCLRTVSMSSPLVADDLALIPTNLTAPNTSGLIAIASTADGVTMQPLVSSTGTPAPIHARVYWISGLTGRFRVLEPIAVSTADAVGLSDWVPLRTGATFFVPQETSTTHSVLYMICPKSTIQSSTRTDGIFPQTRFPSIRTDTTVGFPVTYPIGAIQGRIYDANGTLHRDLRTDCDCFQAKPVTTLNPVYGDPVAANGTYTELISAAGAGQFAFTGYRVFNVTGSPIEFFGRLSNGSRTRLNGTLTGAPAR